MTNTPLPSGCEACSCKLSMVTNWTFDSFSELKILDSKHIVHMPVSNVSLVPFNIAVIYKPRAGLLAIAFFVRSLDLEQLVRSMPISSKQVKNVEDFQSQMNDLNVDKKLL